MLRLELALVMDSVSEMVLVMESEMVLVLLRYTEHMTRVLTLEHFHLYPLVCLEFHNSVRLPSRLLDLLLIHLPIPFQYMCLLLHHIL